MKKFKFSLDKLKSYKEQIKKREENTLASLRAEQLEKLHEKEELLKELDRRNAEFIRKSEKGMTAMEMVTEKGFISYILDSIKAKDKEISIMTAKINKQLIVVTEASREVQTLEKLEEKQLDEYRFKERKADEAFIDEYVGNRRHYGN
ncbi:MAG: flagellar FliJ family protein [Oscillospiraceae bacterium]|nr:flagellar FliJ family protein [Oscillospiraceae bacterium]MBR6695284.1 flagellar FliJ family protein [Oscillospiraceae bacterium]